MLHTPTFLKRMKWLSLLAMASCILIFIDSSLSSISVMACIILVFLASAVETRGKINLRLTVYHVMASSFGVFCMLSSMWANSYGNSLAPSLTVLINVLGMSIVFWSYQEEDSTRDLLTALMWSGVASTLYAMSYFGLSHFFFMLRASIRPEYAFANPNTMGMWGAISTVLFVYFILEDGWKWRYGAIVMPVLLLALSQSRTALIETVLGILAVLFFHYRDQKNFAKSILKILVAGFAAIAAMLFLSRLEVFSGVTNRMLSLIGYYSGEAVRENSVQTRNVYIQAGLEQFWKTPVFGIGIGNTNQLAMAAAGHSTYLHNNFAELLAGGGLVGFCLFYGMTAYLVFKLLPCALRKETVSEACLVILMIRTLADYGTVSYYKKDTHLILLICFLQVFLNERNRRQKKQKRNV